MSHGKRISPADVGESAEKMRYVTTGRGGYTSLATPIACQNMMVASRKRKDSRIVDDLISLLSFHDSAGARPRKSLRDQ